MLVSRSILKKDDDHRVFALFMQFIPLLLWLPLLLVEPVRVPEKIDGWALLAIAGALWAAQQLVFFKSHRFIEVSLREPIHRTQLIWTALFATLFLGETFGQIQIAGMALILSGSVLIGYTRKSGQGERYGLYLAFIAAFLLGAVMTLEKVAVSFFNANAYPVFVTVFSGSFMLLACLRNDLLSRATFQLKKYGKKIALASCFAALGYWSFIQALSQGPAGLVVSIHQLSLVFATFGGIFLLQERQGIPVKLAGMALALAGAWLIRPV